MLQANMDINPYIHDSCNLDMIRMCKKSVNVGSGHVLLCWELMSGSWLRLMFTTLLQTLYACEHQRCLCWWKWNIYWGNVRMAFGLTSIVQCTVLHFLLFKEYFSHMWLEIWDSYKVASLLCSAHFGIRIGGGAQVLNYSY